MSEDQGRRFGGAFAGARALAAAVLFVVLGGASALGQPVTAQSAPNPYVCADLAVRLRTLPPRPATEADRWSSAIAEQREAIAANRASLSRCGSPQDPRCLAFVEREQQMTANLARLQAQFSRMGGAQATGSPEKARLEAAMAQLGCNRNGTRVVTAPVRPNGTPARAELPPGFGAQSAAPPPPRPPQQRNFFSILFGGGAEERTYAPPGVGEETLSEPIDDALAQSMSGSYRTLCVRTCDGFFFPISFTASRSRFATDTNVCKALCPQAETRLYFHANPGQEAEEAVAADSGEPLSRLPNAFLYRSRFVSDCTCGRPDPRLLPAAAGGLRGVFAARAFEAGSFPVPRPRPGPDQDPETQAALFSGLTVEPVAAPVVAESAPEQVTAAVDPPRVRTVGPKYFSDR